MASRARVWNPALVTVSFGVYAALALVILFFYFRGIFMLLPFQERILGSIAIGWPQYAPFGGFLPFWVILIGTVLLALLIVVFRARVIFYLQLLTPPGRGFLLPLPFYLAASGDWIVGAILAVLGVGLLFVGRPLGEAASTALRPIPSFVWRPLGRFWPALIYAALFTRGVVPTLVSAGLLWGLHYLDNAMDTGFTPVWDWQRALRLGTQAGLAVGRVILGLTAPFVLSYSLAWWNPAYDQQPFLYGLAVSAACYFVMRIPGPRPTNELSSREASRTQLRAVPAGLLVAVGAGLALALGLPELALADDCSGPADCAGTTFINNPGHNSVDSLGGSAVGPASWAYPNGGRPSDQPGPGGLFVGPDPNAPGWQGGPNDNPNTGFTGPSPCQ